MRLRLKQYEIRSRQVFSIFVTSLFSTLSSVVSSFVDGVLTGSFLGSEAMAAYGLASPYFTLTTLLSFSFVIAVQTLCTAEIGRGREDEAKNIFSCSIWASVGLSLVVSVLGFCFSDFVAVLFGASDSDPFVKAETARYLHALFPGTVFFCFMSVASVALQIDGATRLVALSALLVASLDIVGDLLNLFVFHGGMGGMGLATTASYVVAVLIMAPYFIRKKSVFSLNPRLYSRKYVGPVVFASYTETILWVMRFIAPVLINRIILSLSGMTAMTAMSMQRNLLSLVSILFYGFGDAAMMQLGLCYGESDRAGVKETMQCILTWLFVITVPVVLLMLLLCRPIAGLYCSRSEAELFRLSVIAVITLALSVPFTAMAKVYLRALQVTARNKFAMILNVSQVIVLPCALTLLLCSALGSSGSLVAYAAAEMGAGLIALALYRKGIKQPDVFPIPDERIFRGTARSPEQAVEVSRQLRSFCQEHDCGRSLSYKLSLCAEEMGCGIIQEALRRAEASRPFVSFIVLLHPDSVVMRITDNCPDQQLRDRALLWKPDDEHPERMIGIRMSMELSTDFQYTRLLNVNNTVISFSTTGEA